MRESLHSPASILPASVHWVAAGEDRFGEHRELGISVIDFSVMRVAGFLSRFCPQATWKRSFGK